MLSLIGTALPRWFRAERERVACGVKKGCVKSEGENLVAVRYSREEEECTKTWHAYQKGVASIPTLYAGICMLFYCNLFLHADCLVIWKGSDLGTEAAKRGGMGVNPCHFVLFVNEESWEWGWCSKSKLINNVTVHTGIQSSLQMYQSSLEYEGRCWLLHLCSMLVLFECLFSWGGVLGAWCHCHCPGIVMVLLHWLLMILQMRLPMCHQKEFCCVTEQWGWVLLGCVASCSSCCLEVSKNLMFYPSDRGSFPLERSVAGCDPNPP